MKFDFDFNKKDKYFNESIEQSIKKNSIQAIQVIKGIMAEFVSDLHPDKQEKLQKIEEINNHLDNITVFCNIDLEAKEIQGAAGRKSAVITFPKEYKELFLKDPINFDSKIFNTVLHETMHVMGSILNKKMFSEEITVLTQALYGRKITDGLIKKSLYSGYKEIIGIAMDVSFNELNKNLLFIQEHIEHLKNGTIDKDGFHEIVVEKFNLNDFNIDIDKLISFINTFKNEFVKKNNIDEYFESFVQMSGKRNLDKPSLIEYGEAIQISVPNDIKKQLLQCMYKEINEDPEFSKIQSTSHKGMIENNRLSVNTHYLLEGIEKSLLFSKEEVLKINTFLLELYFLKDKAEEYTAKFKKTSVVRRDLSENQTVVYNQ